MFPRINECPVKQDLIYCFYEISLILCPPGNVCIFKKKVHLFQSKPRIQLPQLIQFLKNILSSLPKKGNQFPNQKIPEN